MGLTLVGDWSLEIDKPRLWRSYVVGIKRGIAMYVRGGSKNPAKGPAPLAEGAWRPNAQRTTKSLVKSFRFLEDRANMVLTAISASPAAIPQLEGAVIPPFDILARGQLKGVRGKRTSLGVKLGSSRVMFAAVGGAFRFFTKRRGFTLKPTYSLDPIQGEGIRNAEVAWAKGKGGGPISLSGSAGREAA